MSINIVTGDIVLAKERYIAHQCNAVTNHSAGTAKHIFDALPYANIYAKRPFPYHPPYTEQPGNIIICGNGQDQRFVINMIAQWYPGQSRFPSSRRDGVHIREAAFKECLNKIALIDNLESIGLPFKIGCNLGGGNWKMYLAMLEEFEETVDAKVTLYRKE